MLKALIKSRLSAIFSSLTQGSKKKNKSKVSMVLLMVLFAIIIAYVLFAMGALAVALCFMTRGTGNEFAPFTIAVLAASALCLFGSIFATKTQLFESKDNELLLSMPIPPKYILISRMIALVLVNFLLEAIVMLPFMAVYGFIIGFSPLGAVFSILVFILLPFLTLALSCLIAWLVSEVTSRVKNKTPITVILFLLFFGGYMFLCGSIGAFAGEGGFTSIDLGGLKNSLLFYWAGDAMAKGSGLSMLLFFLCCAVPALAAYIILDKTFIKIVTRRRTRTKIEYKGNRESVGSAFTAMLKKEIRRFFTSSAYIMNAGLGNVMCIVLAVFLAVMSKDILQSVPFEGEMVKRVIPFAVTAICTFIASMNLISAPSISLEYKCLWILQSSPVNPKDVLMAKVCAHIIICTPLTLVSMVILCVAYKLSVIASILAVATSLSAVVFTAYWGMLLGLKFPKFDWQNENVAVKQGMAVFGAMFGSMLFYMVLSVLGFILTVINEYLGFIIVLAPSIIASVGIHFYLINGGCGTFEKLKK